MAARGKRCRRCEDAAVQSTLFLSLILHELKQIRQLLADGVSTPPRQEPTAYQQPTTPTTGNNGDCWESLLEEIEDL